MLTEVAGEDSVNPLTLNAKMSTTRLHTHTGTSNAC